jgi:hypothetical protein
MPVLFVLLLRLYLKLADEGMTFDDEEVADDRRIFENRDPRSRKFPREIQRSPETVRARSVEHCIRFE